MPNRRFNKQVANSRTPMKVGGRAMKMGGGSMSTARKDMASGYYKDDMGMKGGAMYKKGGSVKKNTKRMNRLEELGRVDSEKAFGIDFVWSEFLRLGAFCSNRCRLSVSIVCKEMQINPLCKQMSQDRVHSFLRVH